MVYTPKGNIPIVAGYLRQGGLLLDHPTPPFDHQRLQFPNAIYHNPHNPPPGGHARALLGNSARLGYAGPGGSRWSSPAIAGKSVEVHRSQVEEVFKSLRSGDDLEETEPSTSVPVRFVSFAFSNVVNEFSIGCGYETVSTSEEGTDIPTRAREGENSSGREVFVSLASSDKSHVTADLMDSCCHAKRGFS